MIGCLLLLLLLPSHYIISIFSNHSNKEIIIKKHKKEKSKEYLAFPSSSIVASLLTPENSPYTSKTSTPSHSILDDTYICKRLFTDS
jgi:hypothetical protein